ncbi:MAG: putative copper-binding protein plastocyanin/az urin family protein [Naasia sp.]|nr:putative copper-binding protein plastocyanin/az urin family protein [Naasia sp.]
MSILRAPRSAALALPLLALVLSGCMGGTATGGSAEETPAPQSSNGTGTNGTGTPADGAEIVAIGLAFLPADITVPAGTTVRWVNQEAITHSVTSGPWGDVNESTGLRGTQTADGEYDHTLAPAGEGGDTFAFTFEEPGTYQYFCRPHAGMFGTVTVE